MRGYPLSLTYTAYVADYRDIVESGAVASFVSMATNNQGALRTIAIQALRVLSEDVSSSRSTRLQLCVDSAAIALGTTLKDNVAVLSEVFGNGVGEISPEQQVSLKDLQEALCALANVLDPAHDGDSSFLMTNVSTPSVKEPHHLIKGCLDTVNSGGLEALLTIATVRCNVESGTAKKYMALLEEACRSLSSMAPLLLTATIATAGYTKWALNVLQAFHYVLKQTESLGTQNMELQIITLQGLGALAQSAPLKTKIIDETLPYLLQARSVGNESDVSNATNQVFQCLNLADDEEAAQVAGNAPDIYAEWFCLQRSLLLQAMARAEIRILVHNTWNTPFQEIDHGSMELIRQSSGYSRSSDGTREGSEAEVFCCFADDEDSSNDRQLLMRQYFDIYGGRHEDGGLSDDKSTENGTGLLSQQTYPLSSSDDEARWILDHRGCLLNAEQSASLCLSDHVSRLLEWCFPSTMLRDELIPIFVLRPEVSFNFRVLMMAKRKYFSFRREGQLLSSLCAKEAASPGSIDAHWTLGFTNSLFAGEFAESLVQVLYKCPMIRGLSFLKNSDFKAPKGTEKTDENGEGEPNEEIRSGLLANLTGSLPPWISHLTFDGVFDDVDLQSLGSILETMGTLSEGHLDDGTDRCKDGRSFQGRFWFLAIRRSPSLRAEAWSSFIGLLGRKQSIARVPTRSALSSLQVLDLCGNHLGDEVCASILELVYNEYSGCRLEQLDLSDNEVHQGSNVLRVLRAYYDRCVSRMGSSETNWKSTLHTLSLASNGLFREKAWLEIITLVQNNGLGLRSLDLSSNDLILNSNEYEFADIIVHALSTDSPLERLNLSNNWFSSAVVDRIIAMLVELDVGNTILLVDGNSPPLTTEQVAGLLEVSRRTRKRLLERHINEREELNAARVLRQEWASEAQETKPRYKEPSFHEPTIPEAYSLEKCATPDQSLLTNSTNGNSITVLFSAPLVFTDGHTLRPFAKLDFDMERELIWQCLKEASRDIELSFDSATHDRLLATMAKRCSCLHYSGHGHQQYLPFEDGSGGPYWFKVDKFKSLIETEGGAPFRFVFVSACYSYLAGETFASAGVPHVVCCQQESELKDTAALAFTRQFYLALAIGHTVKDSFDQGCKAVRAAPNLKDPDAEMDKFLLLPKDGNHDVPIFNARAVPEWPKRATREERGNRGRRYSFTTSARSLNPRSVLGGARTSELSVRNMMQEDPSPSPPEYFLGREVDTYYVLKAVLSKRLVSVIGEPGVGRSSLVCALCHYINERATTMIGIDRIYFVRARQSRKRNPFRSLVQRFLKKLEEEEKARPIHQDADMETMFDAICKFLKHEKALVVFDRAELVVQADESNEFPMLLSKLCRETKHVKVVLTNRRDLGIPSLGEHPISLGPLNFADTVRLFANLCPYLHTPADRKKLFETLVKDQEEAEVLSTDPGVTESTKRVFAILGDGIPAKIEKSAYDLSKEDFLFLYTGKAA
jgi:NACHT domain